MNSLIEGKIVLITGGVGSIGSELVRQVLKYNPQQVRVFDNRETEIFNLQHELHHHKNIRFLIGDVRDQARLSMAMQKVDLVFHAAALKHVPSCEYNPFEAVKTNVNGTQNVIECALEHNVGKVVNISTDKVTNTVNTMGATKLLAERLVTAAGQYRGDKKTTFCTVRFGNVLRSRGSVIDLFEEQIKRGHPITVTNYDMTRFYILIEQAVGLVFKAADISRGGEIFILKMPTIKLRDLIDVVVEELAPKYGKHHSEVEHKLIGVRPGERLHEELMTAEEAENALETHELFNVLPSIINSDDLNFLRQHHCNAWKTTVKNYSSQNNVCLQREEVRGLLKGAGLV